MTRKLATVVFVVFAISLGAMAQGTAPAAPPPAAPAPSASVAPAVPAPAAAAPATGAQKIGIINVQAAIMATNEGQRDFQTLEKKFEPKRAELQNANAEVENLKKQLTDQGAKLNETARGDLVKNIENKQKVLQRNFEDAQTDWNNQQNDIANRIGNKLLEVMEKYAGENGYSVILDVSGQQSPVLWASSSTNITKQVVDAYNAQSNVAAPAATNSAPGARGLPSAPRPATTRPATGSPRPAPAKKP